MGSIKASQAVIFPEPNRVIVDEVDIPELTSTDVLVEIEYTSISNGTERWCLTGQMNLPGEAPLAFPHVPGYQGAGVVREIGKEVIDLKPGDRVFSRNCRQPDRWMGSWWGGHVRFHVADCQSVIKLPEAVSTREAASLLVAQVGFNGASKPHVQPGDVAVVIGAGLVGQYAGQTLRHRGAYVIMSDLQEPRLEKAVQYSADEVFNSTNKDFAAFIRDRHPEGVAIALEAAGSNKTVRMAIESLSNGGQLILNAFYPQSDSLLDWHWLRTKEITTYCPNSRTRTRLENTLGLIEQGHIKVKELITHNVDYCDVPDAYQMLLDPSADILGITINWQNCL